MICNILGRWLHKDLNILTNQYATLCLACAGVILGKTSKTAFIPTRHHFICIVKPYIVDSGLEKFTQYAILYKVQEQLPFWVYLNT